jgi:protein gp37
MKTTIEWTATRTSSGAMVPGYSFNIAWGCQETSPGCAHCYAKTWAERYGFDVWRGSPRRTFGAKHWAEPLTWQRQAEQDGIRRKVFCSSMADVFEDHPTIAQERAKLWPLIAATPDLDWLLLTKRPENVMQMVPSQWTLPVPDERMSGSGWPTQWPASVWIGTSVENQYWANRRIPALLKIGAQINFLSCEPLLGPVDLEAALDLAEPSAGLCDGQIDWVICGAESGKGSRPMQLDWARKLRDQCQIGGIPFFLKQTAINGRKVSLPELDGRQWAEFPRVEVAA